MVHHESTQAWAKSGLSGPRTRALDELQGSTVRAICVGAAAATAVDGAIALGTHRSDLAAMAAIGLVIGLYAAWQWYTDELDVRGLLVATVVGIGLLMPLEAAPVATILEAALVTVAMIGVLLLGRHHLRRYLGLVVAAWLAGVALNPSTHLSDVRQMVAELIVVCLGAFGTAIVYRAHHALVSAEARFRTFFEETPLAVSILDGSGRLVDVNDAALELFGFPDRDTMFGFDMSDAWDDPSRREEFFSDLVERGRVDAFELEAHRFDGTTRWVRVHGTYNRSEDRIKIILRDITAEKEAREALQTLVREKDRFIAAVSHELRTPLAAVVGFTAELRDGLDELEPGMTRELAGLAAEQAAEVSAIVEDLLAAVRLEVGELTVRAAPVDLAEEVRQTLLSCPLPSATVRGSATVWADPLRVRQIVRNLLTNTGKYGGLEACVEIVHNGTTTALRVIDDGPGVPAGAEDSIFAPYWTMAQSVGNTQSLGLGLSVSRGLAEAMGGTLVYRREGDRTVFEVTLPNRAPAATATGPARAAG